VPTPVRTTHAWTLWVVAVSCALHALEEYATGWQAWARVALGIAMPTEVFVAMNAVLAVAALGLAGVGWRRPALGLVIPAATLANALLFHILPTLVQRRVAPGLYTAALLYVPFSSWALIGAMRDGAPRPAVGRAAIAGLGVAIGVVIVARWFTRLLTAGG
jgi:hypothetical protein